MPWSWSYDVVDFPRAARRRGVNEGKGRGVTKPPARKRRRKR